MLRSYLFRLALGSAIVYASSACRTRASSEREMIGPYSSVTESSCNLAVTLFEHDRALISQTCRAEDGSHQDLKSETPATWTATGRDIVVRYQGGSDSLRFDPALPYNFGREGAGAGLVVKGKPSSSSQFAGYDQLWRRSSAPAP